MLRKITLTLFLSLLSSTCFAMTDDSSHYTGGSPQARVDDPDETDNFQSGSDGTPVQNGRERQLLGGYHNGQQTYGFGSPDGSLSYWIGPSAGYGFQNNGFR